MPNDAERYLHGQSYRATPRDEAAASDPGRRAAPAGFILN